MRGVEIAKRQIKVKTLQNCNTKALLASVGHFQEKFILGLQYRARGGRGAEGQGSRRSRGRNQFKIQKLLPSASSLPMPHNN
jgi:hypothetical protein